MRIQRKGMARPSRNQTEARLSQPQHFRSPTDTGRQLDAFFRIPARCGWDSRAPNLRGT
jgi:hypothetical protein